MLTSSNPQPRREFLRQSTTAVTLLGAAAGLGSLSVPALSEASPKPVAESDLPKVFSTGAGRARKIAIGPGDQIYVAADKQILIFDAGGKKLRTIQLPRPARCLAVNAAGNLYVGLLDHLRIFDASGHETGVWKFTKKSILAGIALSEHEVFVADAGEKMIWRMNLKGVLTGTIQGKNGFDSPAEFFALKLGTDGQLQVANSARHRIESYRTDGEFVTAWGKRSRTLEGFSGCCNPVSFSLLPQGGFVTAERGRPRVKLFSADGQFQKLIAGPEHFSENMRASEKDNTPGCISGGLDVAIDSTGSALVLDRVTGNVHRFSV